MLVSKYRHKAITLLMLGCVHSMAKMRWEGEGGQLIEFKGESDPLHLLLALPPNLEHSCFVKSLKTTSFNPFRREFATAAGHFYRKPVLWIRPFCVIR
ncbi:hypothetical protein A7K73_09075 [Candidatus Methylacidiphilum fumarolicum]|uniref:transposase n=1 Tax=Candidatus Methylacidiphilum fumarolicum TaxID=591154 RepID=UPI0005D36361|nr:transposase [Candidatus Methylacidiphilum fumarolicum]TFE67573.1 hypothetical protein A7K73_09075 [Candidatus Methylacidiphilum fumarolicum]TFE75352.1 hypothetical protein A7D33_01815 [Candidatus Methylacidiphilum fumarolicum]